MNDSGLDFKAGMNKFWQSCKKSFNISDDLEPQADAEESIRAGVSFKGSQLLVLIFAIFIASLGLNTNSIPVIIGAMLISPLMGPIIGIGLGIGVQDFSLVKVGVKNIGLAILGSLLASALYFLISPQYEGSSQLLARTSPSIYDVFVALFGGAAGIVSIACKNKGQVMPGVAIATSLMPPLCTAGYGLATLQAQFFFGALYLFFTNMMFILFASWIGVKLMGYKKRQYENEKRARKVQRIVYCLVIATVCLSGYLTVVMIQKNIFMTKAAAFVEDEMVFPNTQVLSHKEYIDKGKRIIDVTLIGSALPKDSLKLAMLTKLDSVGLGGTELNIRQGFSYDATAMMRDNATTSERQVYQVLQAALDNRDNKIDSLENLLQSHRQSADESVRIAPEIRVLFPKVKDIAMSRMVASSVDEPRRDTIDMLFVNSPQGLSVAERNKLVDFMEVRTGVKNIHVTINPSGFPWPKGK